MYSLTSSSSLVLLLRIWIDIVTYQTHYMPSYLHTYHPHPTITMHLHLHLHLVKNASFMQRKLDYLLTWYSTLLGSRLHARMFAEGCARAPS